MSSRRRKLASRANGRKSHGPVTPEGKARSAANAPVRHGLSASADRVNAASICLLNENREEFLKLYDSFTAEHTPTTITEEITVREMAIAQWRLQRALAMEAALLDNQMEHMAADVAKDYETLDEPTRTTLAFRKLTEESPTVGILHRYETRLARQIDRCLKRLVTLRAEKGKCKLQGEPSPNNEHQESNVFQLPPAGPPVAAPLPAAAAESEPAIVVVIDAPLPTSTVAHVSGLARRDDPDPPAEPASPFPRTA